MDFLSRLRDLGGYWKWNGGRYLAKLTSGKISDEFVNTGVLTCCPQDLATAVEWLIHQPCPDGNDKVDTFAVRYAYKGDIYVCGPAFGGVTLAYEVARQLRATAIFTEPMYGVEDVDPVHIEGGRMKFHGKLVKTGQALKRFEIPEGATVLFVEDVITTGNSTREMFEAVCGTRSDLRVLPYVLCLVNRSGLEYVPSCTVAYKPGSCLTEGATTTSDWPTIISLADIRPRTWDTIVEAQMDLRRTCKNHSIARDTSGTDGLVEVLPPLEAVRPKDNWKLLTEG